MLTPLSSNGQLTIPKHIRGELGLLPGTPVEFSVNAAGEVVLHRTDPDQNAGRAPQDRFDIVRGRAEVPWRTDELMRLLRAED